MRLFFTLIFALILSFATIAQKAGDELLATATGRSFRLSDLSPEIQKDVADLPAKIPRARVSLLEQMVSRRVFDAEAKTRGMTMGKLIAAEKAKIKDPADAEIQKVLDANAERLASLPPEKARQQVVAYLRNAPEQKALGELYTQLKTKYNVTASKDVNAKLLPTDVVARVNGQPITAKQFEDFVEIPLYEARAEIADVILGELDNLIFNALVIDEAKAMNIGPSDLIAREITNKMKDFTEAERFGLEDAFRTRLLTKYQVKVLYSEPAAPVQNISVDDDPSTGPATAPVTVIMFSDFQCSACAATHPVLKKVMAEFPGKVRFVVRDFPLETIHANAFEAALAAGAADKQGKFTEYTELLYKRQNALDVASLKKYAAEIGLNAAQFELDFKSEKTAAEVRKDVADGESYAINSTPTIFVNGVRLRTFSAAGFRAAIERALRK